MPSDCCYFVDKAAAAGAAPALNYFGSIVHCPAVFTQNWGQTRKWNPWILNICTQFSDWGVEDKFCMGYSQWIFKDALDRSPRSYRLQIR